MQSLKLVLPPSVQLSSAQTSIKAMSAYILAVFVDEQVAAQEQCLDSGLMEICLDNLRDKDPQVRQWICFLLAKVRCFARQLPSN